MSGGNGYGKWWANRKSRMGMQPSAKPPPHLPGKEWWTTPPTAPPEPECMEYAVRFQEELAKRCALSSDQNERRESMRLLATLMPWMRAARALYHERVLHRQEDPRDDLSTTDGLIHAAAKSIGRLKARLVELGDTISDRDEAVADALQQRDSVTTHRYASRMRGLRP